jgi:hypothetical protein
MEMEAILRHRRVEHYGLIAAQTDVIPAKA